MRRIAFLGNQLTSGGGATSLFLMLRSLRHDPIKKYVWLTQINSPSMRSELSEFCEEVKLIEMDDLTSCQTKCASDAHMNAVLEKMKGVDELISRLKKHQIEILHVNNSVFTHVYERVKAETDVKIVSHVREWVTFGGVGKVQKYIIDKIERYSDAVVAISPTEAEMFNHPSVYTIANPFDLRDISLDSEYESSNGQREVHEFKVGMVARPSLSKGQIEFLKALQILTKDPEIKSPFTFTIIGLSKPRLTLRKLAKRLLGRDPYYVVHRFVSKKGLRAQVNILPYQENILSKVNQFDVVVRPSKYGDPWGRDVIEAMALEKPVVAFGSSSFFIEEGKTGYLAENGNVAELAQKIKYLIQDPELAKNLGRQAKEKVLPMVDINGYNKKILSVYSSLGRKDT